MVNKKLYPFIGKKILHDLYHRDGALLLKKGTVLTPKLVARLIDLDVKLFDLFYEYPEENMELLSPFDQERLLDNTIGEIREIFSKIRDDETAIKQLETKVMPVVKQISCNYDLCTLLNGLKSKDDYTYRHNIGVAILASLLAKWLGYSEEEINIISTGGLLHDIGKVRIPNEILNKKGKLTAVEYDVMKKHPIFGYEILCKVNDYKEEVARIALEHHERNDGNGYPYKKTADEIHEYSKIIAIADVFHAMSSDRIYRKGLPITDVLTQMRNDSFGMLEPEMTAVFIIKMMNMSIGNTVILNNGQKGEIVFIHRDDPVRPLIRIGKDIVDLRYLKLNIESFLQEPITVERS